MKRPFRARSTALILFALLLLLLLGEGLMMVALRQDIPLRAADFWRVTAIDAGMLALLLAPFIYFAFIRPHRLLQERFLGVLDAAPDAIVGLDHSGKIVFANAQVSLLTGHPAAELLGRPFHELLVPDSRPAAQEAFDRSVRGEALSGVEIALRGRSGVSVPVEVSSHPTLAAGEFLGGVAVLREISARKEAERALRESEERYRALFENANDLIHSVAADGTFLLVNPAWQRTLGYTPAEVRGLTIFDVLDHSVHDHCRALFQKVLEGGDQPEVEATLVAHDGRRIAVEGSVTALRRGGQVAATFAILRDVTERRRLEEQVFRTQQDWKDAFDTLTDMITVHDADFRIIHANRAAQRILGLPLLEGGDAKCFTYYHGTACPPAGCPSCQSLQTGEPSSHEIFEPHLQRHLEIRAIPRRDRAGRLVGLIHVVRDITEHKRAEDALRESEWRYRLLFENNPLPMWVYDLETLSFLEVNAAAVAHYGYTREEFLAMTILGIRPPEEVPRLMERVRERRTGQAAHSGVFTHLKKDGTAIRVDITANPITFGGRAAVLILAADVTEQARLEGQLRHAQKMEAVGQLAGGVAHDFNNMLAVVAMYANLLREGLADRPELGSHADHILATAERGANLTRSLLTFSRKEAAHLAPLDLAEVLGNLAKLLRRVLGEEIQVRVELPGRPLAILADRGQIEQVIMNLCTNARDAMPRGGRLTIGVEDVEIDASFIRAEGFGAPGSYAVLRVADTGTGMDAPTRARIFEPFFTTKEVGRGTGLGLAIVYGIVKQHDGFIGLESREGGGTTFRVFLPRIAERAESETPRAEEPPPRGTECILLAEDEPEVRRVTAEILTASGYRVIEAADGEEALRRHREAGGAVDLFFSDVVMPNRSGREAYEEMRRTQPGLRVLYTSGYTADLLEQRGLTSGEITFVAKPASPSAILRKVREALDAR